MKQSYRRCEDGIYRWFDGNGNISESAAPFVQDDTLKTPLRHMVTGEICTSKSRLRQLDRENGCVCVGNDKLGYRGTGVKPMSEEKALDYIYRAEAIIEDPTKLRAFRNYKAAQYENRGRAMRNGLRGWVLSDL